MNTPNSEQSETVSELNNLLSEKSQKEWLEHIAGWLEYQKVCGASEWRVDDIGTYTSTLINRSLTQSRKISAAVPKKLPTSKISKRPDHEHQDSSSTPPPASSLPLKINKKTVQSTALPEDRDRLQSQKLGGKWSAVSHRIHKGVEKRDSFSYLQVPTGPEGMKHIREFHSEHGCPNCLLGRGALNASVVLIESHSESMNVGAFGMLKNMRERVLNLGKEQLFWLPFPRGEDCGACTQLFRAQLGVLSPQAVLLMGTLPISHLDFASNVPEVGEHVYLNHKGKEIPLVRTENPMAILQVGDPAEQHDMKMRVLKHLRQLHSILADLRIVKRLR